jgi:hypothetical protein
MVRRCFIDFGRLFGPIGLLGLAAAASCAEGSGEESTPTIDGPSKIEPAVEAGHPLPPRGDASPGADAGKADDADAAHDGATALEAGADGGTALPLSLGNGLVLYMTFDSATAVDATGNHPPSAITVSTVTSAPDRFGHSIGAARFSGTPASLIQIGPPNMMPLGNAERSMTVWVRPRIPAPPATPALPNSNVFVHWGIDDCTSKMFGLGNRADHGFAWTGCVDIDSSLAVPPTTWTFMAVTYKADGTLTLVVDSSRVTHPNVTLQTTAAPLAIGGERKTYGQGFTSYFDGDLDDVRVYSRVLTDPELAALAADH